MPDDRETWDAIAPHWDAQVGEGTDFQRRLVWPATDRLLAPRPGMRVLDACCGNGNHARRLGRLGCRVVAFDGSEAFVEIARKRTTPADGDVAFRVADALDAAAVLALGEPASFDAAVCTMALMDLPDVAPLLSAVRKLLAPGSPFVFSTGHPAFHTNESRMWAEQSHGEGEPTQTFGLVVTRYATDWPHSSRGLLDQPVPNAIYHRSLSTLLNAAFAAGFALDGLEEPTFAPDTRARSPFSWARRPDLPPVLVGRLR